MPITPTLGRNLDALRDVLERAANQLGKYPAALLSTYTVATMEDGHGAPLFALQLMWQEDTFVIMHRDIEAGETAWRPVVTLPVPTRVTVAKSIPDYINFVTTTATDDLTDDTLQTACDIEESLAQLDK